MHEMVLNVITAALYKRRKFRMFKRSDPRKRMRNRMYYKKNRARIKAKRRLYRIRNKPHLRLRKQKSQVSPMWFQKRQKAKFSKPMYSGQKIRSPHLRNLSMPKLRRSIAPKVVSHARNT